MQPQREAFKLKPGFSFSSSDTSNEEESAGPFKLRFGDATDEAPSIASLFGPRIKPAALPDKVTPSPSNQLQLAAVEAQPVPQDAVVQPPSMAFTPAPKSIVPAPTLAAPDEQTPKRSLGLVKGLQLSAAPSVLKLPEIKRLALPAAVEPNPKKLAAKASASSALPLAPRIAAQDTPMTNTFDASDPKPTVDFPVAASALPAAAIVPAAVLVPVVAQPMPMPPTPTPMAISVPAQVPDQGVAIETAASMHEKRLEDCTLMAKRLEEMLGSLGNYKERLSELLLQQACLNAEILITNSPQLMDLARGSVGAEE